MSRCIATRRRSGSLGVPREVVAGTPPGPEHRTRRNAKLSFEEARKMRLVGEAGAQRDVGERHVGRVEQGSCVIESQLHQVSVGCAASGFLERSREVGAELEKRKIPFAYRTEISSTTFFNPGEIRVLVVNTTGELRLFYENATLVFVGKTLMAEGGQNPIEPGAIGKAMVFGPNMQNFQAIAAAFRERNFNESAALAK